MEIFDPFNTSWVSEAWHNRIVQTPAPATSRVYGVEISGGPCALWCGWNNGIGYGKVRVNGEIWLLHRYAFACHYDVALTGHEHIDHLCRRRACFNPFHHESTTPLENYRRGDGPLTAFKSFRERVKKNMDEIPF